MKQSRPWDAPEWTLATIIVAAVVLVATVAGIAMGIIR